MGTIFSTFASATIDGPSVMLTVAASEVLAMVLHELVTNAAKYGALSTPHGRMEVTWPYEDAVMGSPIFEENPPARFKGIDVMRTIRSFDPCLPCGVHLYGGGRVTRIDHSPMLGITACAPR